MGMITTSLSHALFTQAQQRVLALLFGHPERSFYANEIIQLADSGTGVIQRELTKLTASRIINCTTYWQSKTLSGEPPKPHFF
jgi:hypothetical protein